MIVAVVLLALVLLLAPVLAAVPEGSPIWGAMYAPGLSAFWQYPGWPAILSAVVMLAALVAALPRRDNPFPLTRAGKTVGGRAERAFAVLVAIALLSLIARVVEEHGVAYIGPMLNGWAALATDCALFALTRRLAGSGRLPFYLLALAALAASAVVADVGVNEYLYYRHLDPGRRIFATSTPDFLAGYLVMVLPVTLAWFIAVPLQKQKRPLIGIFVVALLLVVLAYQTMALLRTQSRFGLVSVSIALVVFLISLGWATRRGLEMERSSWWRLGGVGVFIMLIGLSFARPLINRLRNTSAGDNSTAFRLYTWRGSLNMAASNPVLGTGVGTYVHLYPRYAITGFTRLAHNSYIQMADECGLPGLLALLMTLGLTFGAVARGLAGSPKSESADSQSLAAVAPADDRVLLCGLLAGLSAAAVQNLVDSDWYVFFLGATFWALAGLAVGRAAPATDGALPALAKGGEPPRSRVRGGLALAAALIFVRMVTQAVAAAEDQRGVAAAASPGGDAAALAEQSWAEARAWDPLNARYPNELGNQVFLQREGRLGDAESALRDAVRLEPSSLNYSSLARILAQEHRYAEAITALRSGLKSDPNSLDLRLFLAQLLPPPQSVEYMRQITALEDSPVGRVRAIGNITEYKFAIADAAVADAARDPAEAQRYYQRAAQLLDAYADEGGTLNFQRQVLIGDHPNPDLDKQMWNLYTHVMGRLVALAPPAEKPALQATAKAYRQKFADVFAHASEPGIL